MVRVLLSSKEKFIIKTKNEAGSNAMDSVHSNNEVPSWSHFVAATEERKSAEDDFFRS